MVPMQSGIVLETTRKFIFATTPKISVITVCYNAVKTIEQTIASVTEQVGVDLEYIVIDGGSTDGTVDILRRTEDAFSLWVSEPDGGIYDAMNKGLQHARGEWVLFLNADDYLVSPTSLVNLLAAATPDVAIVAGGTLIKYNDCERSFRSSHYFGLPLQLPFMHPSTIVRRGAFEKWGGFDTRYRLAADCDLLLRLISQGERFRLIETPITVMRDGGASAKGYILGRREYREAYRTNMGGAFAAWFGYGVSILMHLKAKLR